MNKVEERFIQNNLVHMRPGNKWFIMSKSVSIEFIDSCKREGIDILGIDGFFFYHDGRVEPSMEDSIDFSSTYNGNRKTNIYELSRQFILTRKDNLFFEVICLNSESF